MGKSSEYHNNTKCFEHPSSLEKIYRLFDFNVPKIKILDLGCGDGKIAEELIKKGHEVDGLDSSGYAVNEAKKKGINAVLGDVESTLPFAESSFDLVLLLDVLEHLYDQEVVLKNIYEVLKPGGQLIISYPNHFDLRNRLNILFGGGIIHWDHKKYENAKAWKYAHIRFLLFKELEELLRENKFYINKVQYNFMGGGIIPSRLTPKSFRKFLLRFFPQLFTGKYIISVSKEKTEKPEIIYLNKTVLGI